MFVGKWCVFVEIWYIGMQVIYLYIIGIVFILIWVCYCFFGKEQYVGFYVLSVKNIGWQMQNGVQMIFIYQVMMNVGVFVVFKQYVIWYYYCCMIVGMQCFDNMLYKV